MHMESRRNCELCSNIATIYCPSDSAYLCNNCDSTVHSANFLVARHVRSSLCLRCGDLAGKQFSGDGFFQSDRDLCGSCIQEPDDDVESSSLSSVCLSTTESSVAGRREKDCSAEVSSAMRRKKAEVRVDGILVNWCMRLELEGNSAKVVVETASSVFRRLRCVAPLRVALATSFWCGVRFCGDKKVDTCRNLIRVVKITGVPAKLILAVEGKLGRVAKTRRPAARESDYKEGWAEC